MKRKEFQFGFDVDLSEAGRDVQWFTSNLGAFLRYKYRMGKSRTEAFSDGVTEILIIMMGLEMHIPEVQKTATDEEIRNVLRTSGPSLIYYLLWFAMIAFLGSNHHALFEHLPYSNPRIA